MSDSEETIWDPISSLGRVMPPSDFVLDSSRSSFSQTKKNWPERLLPRPSTPQTLTHNYVKFIFLRTSPLKGEVWAICRFWVFDGNAWALGAPTNRFPLVWEKSSNVKWLKSALKKSSKYCGISCGNDSEVMSAFIFAPIFAPLSNTHFCVWLRTLCRLLVVEGSVIRSWFFAKPLYSSDPRCSKKNTKLDWTNLPWHASQKTRFWPVCR